MNSFGQAGVGKKVCLCAQLRAAEKDSKSEPEQRTLAKSNARDEPCKNSMCPKGYPFSREGGERCVGGTHHANDEDESKVKAGSDHPAVCSHGYPFSREGGTRCKGGTHRIEQPEEEKSPEDDGGANNNTGPSCCCHCCTHMKCKTGLRRECATVDQQFPCPLRRLLPPLKSPCQRVECEHGYVKNDGPNTDCPTYSTSSTTKKPKDTSSTGFSEAKMSNQPINGGCACQCQCSCHQNEGKNNMNRYGMHRDLCPYGFRFIRDKGTRCYGGNHRRQRKMPGNE